MTEGYAKLFNTIVVSSVWQEDDATRLVWITMLALADRDGIVNGSLPGLAHIARVPLPSCEKAIAILSAPDPSSQNPAHEGRRIEKVERGWAILNYAVFRRRLSIDERREYKRLKQQQYRGGVDNSGQCGTLVDGRSHNADAKTEADAQKRQRGLPTLEDAIAYGTEIKMPQSDVESWYDHFESNGWKVGGKAPMKDWKAALRNAKRRPQHGTHKQKPNARIAGTANEKTLGRYGGVGQIR